MAQALEVSLTTEQEHELSWARDHQEKFYLRVKCAAILNVAHGCSVRQVARTGLLKPVRQETVSEWTRRYLAEGRDGLLVRTGRGRKPAFSRLSASATNKLPTKWPKCCIALLVATGQVLVRRRGSFNGKEMSRFFYHSEQHSPHADVISIALDSWPHHVHGYVRDNLARSHRKMRWLPLPTYAPWTNPIEKFWKKLNREFMSQHSYGRSIRAFCDALDLCLDKHREESAALLHEVGLLPKEGLEYLDYLVKEHQRVRMYHFPLLR